MEKNKGSRIFSRAPISMRIRNALNFITDTSSSLLNLFLEESS